MARPELRLRLFLLGVEIKGTAAARVRIYPHLDFVRLSDGA